MTEHGWFVLDKPLGLSSNQAMARVKRALGVKKAGYLGTLDPLATGVLPIALGEATKMIPYVQDEPKEYLFDVQFGQERATDDLEGDILAEDPRSLDELNTLLTRANIDAAMTQFMGHISQMPPVYSAIKVQGKRACDRVRAGEHVELKPRQITIHALTLQEIFPNASARFLVSCSKGTYVRSLGRDLAQALGTFGYISFLRRVRTGAFTLEHATPLEDVK